MLMPDFKIKFNETLTIKVEGDDAKNKFYYENYYKKHIHNFHKKAKKLLNGDIKLLEPYLKKLIKKFNLICSNFKPCEIVFCEEIPEIIHENEYIFYIDDGYLNLAYQDEEVGNTCFLNLSNAIEEDQCTKIKDIIKEKKFKNSNTLQLISKEDPDLANELANLIKIFTTKSLDIIFEIKEPEAIHSNEYVFYIDKEKKLSLVYKNKNGEICYEKNLLLTEDKCQEIVSIIDQIKIYDYDLKKTDFKLLVYLEIFIKSKIIINNLKNINDLPTPKIQCTIDTIFTKFEDAISKNFDILISRINEDLENIIIPAFLENGDDVKLKNIIPAGDELHNRGNQVFILEFTYRKNGENRNKKVVYKPSPITADFIILGDCERYNKLDRLPNKINFSKSFVEIMNDGLGVEYNFTKKDTLPKYLVVPCKDERNIHKLTSSGKEGENLHDVSTHYGYIEYISREPKFKEGEEKTLEENISRRTCTDYVIYDSSNETLRGYSEQYSLQMGLYMALMLATGLVDSHDDNLIARIGDLSGELIDKLCRYLIDAEAAFSLNERNLYNISCLDPEIGSLNVPVPFLTNIDNGEIKINHIIFSYQNGAVEPVHLIFETIQEGIKKGLDVLRDPVFKDELSRDVKNWFNQIESRKDIFVRIVPANTGTLQNYFSRFQEVNFDKEKFKKVISKIMNLNLNVINFDLQAMDYIEHKDQRFLFYLEPNIHSLIEEAEYQSLVTCYANVNNKKLYLSNGKELVVPSYSKLREAFEKVTIQDIEKKLEAINESLFELHEKSLEEQITEHVKKEIWNTHIKEAVRWFLEKLKIEINEEVLKELEMPITIEAKDAIKATIKEVLKDNEFQAAIEKIDDRLYEKYLAYQTEEYNKIIPVFEKKAFKEDKKKLEKRINQAILAAIREINLDVANDKEINNLIKDEVQKMLKAKINSELEYFLEKENYEAQRKLLQEKEMTWLEEILKSTVKGLIFKSFKENKSNYTKYQNGFKQKFPSLQSKTNFKKSKYLDPAVDELYNFILPNFPKVLKADNEIFEQVKTFVKEYKITFIFIGKKSSINKILKTEIIKVTPEWYDEILAKENTFFSTSLLQDAKFKLLCIIKDKDFVENLSKKDINLIETVCKHSENSDNILLIEQQVESENEKGSLFFCIPTKKPS